MKPPQAGLRNALAKVEFSGVPDADYIKVSALLDNIRTLGRDCEWALKVDKQKKSDCVQFIQKLQPNGEYKQTFTRLTNLNADPENSRFAGAELPRILRHIQEIVRYKEFMLARLGISSQ